ncbi:MAG: phospholipid carrier-dependent glycosyltransferase [Chloroflexi bacterium AL-W]|nr:phospholipid carrier-dependent glycosyltransferase [Chloroflexi bacterium AL-N10]NOK75245.1 phospholipid carrier-dependent glycosyltransferase [Chloroflexi bacterium AL-N5]NOK82033.1 phospholipid carrier-dependent glycosyltransferase [Chloroflexi bacterium AL-W]NOK89878.1 phospholipid carrier-dependent glycosyltransferase [Chloroflexi bacterium AL-N15]
MNKTVGIDSEQQWSRWWILLSYIVVGVTALWLRVTDLGLFISGDEANFWIRRSEVFWAALRSGDYGATALTEHPGVTTMWLGSLGI